jgi:hypothetical protein
MAFHMDEIRADLHTFGIPAYFEEPSLTKPFKEEVLSYYHARRQFATMNKQELLGQMKEWKKLKCSCIADNVHTFELDGHTFYSFVIQARKKSDNHICPFGLSLGMMVSGWTYLTTNKSTADMVVQYLN